MKLFYVLLVLQFFDAIFAIKMVLHCSNHNNNCPWCIKYLRRKPTSCGRFDPYKLRDYVSHTVKVSKNRVITWQFNSAQNADDVNITFFLWEDGKEYARPIAGGCEVPLTEKTFRVPCFNKSIDLWIGLHTQYCRLAVKQIPMPIARCDKARQFIFCLKSSSGEIPAAKRKNVSDDDICMQFDVASGNITQTNLDKNENVFQQFLKPSLVGTCSKDFAFQRKSKMLPTLVKKTSKFQVFDFDFSMELQKSNKPNSDAIEWLPCRSKELSSIASANEPSNISYICFEHVVDSRNTRNITIRCVWPNAGFRVSDNEKQTSLKKIVLTVIGGIFGMVILVTAILALGAKAKAHLWMKGTSLSMAIYEDAETNVDSILIETESTSHDSLHPGSHRSISLKPKL